MYEGWPSTLLTDLLKMKELWQDMNQHTVVELF